MIKTPFVEEDVNIICQIKPREKASDDGYSWIFNNTRDYFVKSWYWVWLNKIKEGHHQEEVNNPSLNPLFQAV